MIITSIATLIPMIIGILLWNKLPDELPTHWNFSGEIDGYSSKAFAVFFLPLFVSAAHIICAFATMHDPRNKHVAGKINRLVLWICPVMAMFISMLIYPAAMHCRIDAVFMVNLLLGGMLIVFGNYLPKCRQNDTIGIRTPWTLGDAENWNRTHRMAGPLWIAGGFVILVNSFIKWKQIWVEVITFAVLIMVPTVYSIMAYHDQRNL